MTEKLTKNNLTRREWLVGGTALTGGLMLAGTGHAQSITMEGYTPTLENPIRMSANENPYGLSVSARNAIQNGYDQAALYSARSIQRELVAQIATMESVQSENIIVGAGSGSLLRNFALTSLLEGGKKILTVEPTFHNMTRYAEAHGMETVRLPVDENMKIDLDALEAAYTDDVSIIYICNPNNPLPTVVNGQKLKAFCEKMSQKCYVFVDEAYYEYVTDPDFESMIPLAVNNDRIFVARTASKIHGMAGLRVGFGFGTPNLIRKLRTHQTGSVNVLGMLAAKASYADVEYQNFVLRKCRESLQICYDMFEKHGIEYIKSNGNFTFFKTGVDVGEVRERMMKRGISLGRPFPPFTDWCRVSMARPEDMAYFVESYEKEFLS